MDNELKQFFDDWKKADQRHQVPEFPKSAPSQKKWYYAAAAVVVLASASVYFLQETPETNSEITRDSSRREPAKINSDTTDIYAWESPTESLASDF